VKHGMRNNTTILKIDIGIDGLNLSESSNLQAWPILARCEDLLDNSPFCVGIFCGYSKPNPLEEYLADFKKEVLSLIETGFTVKGLHFDVCISKYILDAPARAYIKFIVGHTGYFSCERCTCEGEYDGDKVVFETYKCAPRSDESFRAQTDENHHNGVSPLVDLPTNFIDDFVYDPLHLLFHGVGKRFLRFLTSVCRTGARQC